MNLSNFTPEQRQAWQALVDENQQLKLQLAVYEDKLANAERPALLPRLDFIREVARMAAHDQRYGATSSMLALSFEGLGKGQEKLGPLYTKIIQMIADTTLRNVRSCDIVGRTGIDDFGILLSHCARPAALLKAESLIGKIKDTVEPLLYGKGVPVALRYVVSPVELKKPG